MKKLGIYLKDYTKESVLAPLFKLLEALFDLFVPVVIARIINEGITLHNPDILYQQFALLIGLALMGLLCSIVAQYFAAKASVGFTTKLRQALFDHIQSFSYAEMDKVGVDTLITRLTSDANQVQNGLNLALRLLLRSPFIVFGSMIMAFTINVKAAVIFAVVIPLLCLVVFAIMLISIPLFKKVQKELDRLLTITRENLTGMRVIRAFRLEQQEVKEFDAQNEALTKQNELVGRLSACMNPATYVLINLATVVLIYVGALQVSYGTMLQGDVVALYNYMAQIVVELIKMASLIITIDKSIACAERIQSVLDIEPCITYPATTAEETEDTYAICFDHVRFAYEGSKEDSLEDISFAIEEGKTLGIIGPTGCGKSTCVELIPRFYDVTQGKVTVLGKNVKNYSQKDLMELIGSVPQKAVVFQGTIRDNLKLGNEQATDEELWKALQIAQAKSVVEEKEGQLDYVIEQGGKNLSGGQKQRLTIARALVKDPRILILDDSASALDFATDAALRKALHSLKKTTVLVSQRISTIRSADLIVVLEDGKLKGKGTHEELMQSCPTYQDIYYSQYPEEKKEVSAHA